MRMLADEPALRHTFDEWKAAHPAQLSDPKAVLRFLFIHGRRHAEPEWRCYPVAALILITIPYAVSEIPTQLLSSRSETHPNSGKP